MFKDVLVISAVNLVEGGTLTILNNCLSFLNSNSFICNNYRVIALVHNKNTFHFENIEFREFPLAKRNWFFRMYYEYIGFNKVSKSLKPKLWLSLHDMSPIVTAERKAVYCHNSTPFYHVKLNQIRYSYKLYLFSVFYKYIYRINIKSNTYVRIYKIPYFFFRCMKYMCPIFMDINPFNTFTINISSSNRSHIKHKAF